MNKITLRYHRSRPTEGYVTLPGSKSVAARALILNSIYGDGIKLEGLPDCDDTTELSAALNQLRRQEGKNRGGESVEHYDLGTGGTSLRFFLAYVASLNRFCGIVDCSEALRSRPLAPLIESLRSAGAEIECLGREGYAPVMVRGHRLTGTDSNGGNEISSQYSSALMMASRLWHRRYEPRLSKGAVSQPYIVMTSKIIDEFEKKRQEIHTGHAATYEIEGDWSAASYFYELVLTDPYREVRLVKLVNKDKSVQGDSECAEIFDEIGVKSVFEADGSVRLHGDVHKISSLRDGGATVHLDLAGTPDLVPAISVGLCLAGIRYCITGIGHLRHKESDRMAALRDELAKSGYRITVTGESLAWNGERVPVGEDICFDAHGDHRMAMSLAVSAVRMGTVSIFGAETVAKSYPGFFEELSGVGFTCGN